VFVTALAAVVLVPQFLRADVGTPQSASSAGSTAATGATSATGATAATDDPNNYTCYGHIQGGKIESGVSGTEVEYQFSCNGPITGYQIETEPHQIEYFDQAPAVALAGVPASTDSFSCSAFVPGVQLNCTGQTSAAFEVITGQFVINGAALCVEPRLDPILTVTDATASAGTAEGAATATQYISGPFDLGRPWGCLGDRYGADTRLGSDPPMIVLMGPPPARRSR
jgi:hypothetical protein